MPEKIGGLFKALEHPTSGLFKALSHPIRIKMVEHLQESVELSYTELLNLLNIDAGHLNFHLKIMGELIRKTKDGNYVLTDKGSVAYCMINAVKELGKGEIKVIIPQASILKRTLATAVDFTLFIGSPMALMFLINIWAPLNPHEGTFPLLLTMFLHAVFFLTFVVFMLMETYNGQTLGKYLVGIRAIKDTGRRLNLVESTVRNILKVYFLPFDLLMGLFTRKKGYIRFADYYTKAKVVNVSVKVEHFTSSAGGSQ